MQVDFAFPADAAILDAANKLNMFGAGFEDIWAETFPVVHPSMAFVVRLRVHPTETDREHSLGIELWAPDGARLAQMQITFNTHLNPTDSTRDPLVVLVLNFQQTQFPAAGAYAFHVIVDGTHLKAVPVYVGHRPTEAAPPEQGAV